MHIPFLPRKETEMSEPHKDQKLIVDFIKNEEGNDCVTLSFDPEIPEVRTPAQAAAVNVANHIIQSFGLGRNEQPKKEIEHVKKSSIILPK